MNPNLFRNAFSVLVAVLALLNAVAQAKGAERKPNFILILCDDLGYGDVSPYGGVIPTPALDPMANEGLVATQYYSPANLCTPSRAGILTGRYPVRTGLAYEVIRASNDDRALPLSEKTIAAALKPDYVSGLFGKWHLGHTGPKWLPIHHGFDVFYGLPYSHDMRPLQIYDADVSAGDAKTAPADLPNLQQMFYARAERFIETNRDRPFFVELALSSPHLPDHPNVKFKGTSKVGPHGDTILEIDSIVGRLLDKLTALKLDQNTIVVFTSDNGAWFEGSNGPLRDRKSGASFDGGYHVPFLVWGPGIVKPGKTDAIISGIDLLPTFVSMAGQSLPQGVQIDGRDVSGVLTKGAPSPHDAILLFDYHEELTALRTPRWKYVPKLEFHGGLVNLDAAGYRELLFDMSADPSESYNMAEVYPEVLRDMQKRFKEAQSTYAPLKKGGPPPIRKKKPELQPQK